MGNITMKNPVVVVIDDESSILEITQRYFEHAGFMVHTAVSGSAGLELARQVQPDLVVLDVMLPGLNGFQVLELLRAESSTPVLMLTARAEEMDRLRGLESGADDYLVKPFSPRELVARAKAILRRGAPIGEHLQYGDLELDITNRAVLLEGETLTLTQLEFDLLALLARSPGRLWAREELLERIWGPDFAGVDRVVDVHLSSLRRKLGSAGVLIQTVRGVGYRFVVKA
jgi:two-component system alkaline phosphatase synthesis response regulator PhoP